MNGGMYPFFILKNNFSFRDEDKLVVVPMLERGIIELIGQSQVIIHALVNLKITCLTVMKVV